MSDETRELQSKNPHQALLDMQRAEIERMNEITRDVITESDKTSEKADEMYQYMQDLIDIESDKSDSTREMMGKALDVKLGATNQKIEILKLKAKLLTPGKAATSVNINLGEYDQKKGSDTNGMIDIVEQIRGSEE